MSKKAVYPGVYFNDKLGRYSYRPRINGKRTEKLLKARTEAEAIREFIKKEDARTDGEQPIAKIVQLYLAAGAPDKAGTARDADFVATERYRIEQALPFWGKFMPGDIEIRHCVEYRDWRVKRVQKVRPNCSGLRSVDVELTTLSNALHYGVLLGKAAANRITSRPKFDTERSHCRDHCPRSGDELHMIANRMARHWASQVLMWQMLFEACSGCRTGEVMPLRWDAAPCQPGHIREGKYICICRLKQIEDVDPYEYITINPALKLVLDAMKNWNDNTRRSAWFFPSGRTNKPVLGRALCQRLRFLAKKLLPGRRLTSHGMRAFYVTWQRMNGRPLQQIADDIGHISGVGLICTTYGRRLPPWATADCTPFPKTVTPAWEPWLKKHAKIIRLKAAGE